MSETLRNKFIADPINFVQSHYGHDAGISEQAYLRSLGQLYADGMCCKGCGCAAADTFRNMADPAALTGVIAKP